MNRVVWGEWEHREVCGSPSARTTGAGCAELDDDELAGTGRMSIQLKQVFTIVEKEKKNKS